ncbi:MAG: hypothetical protein ACXAEU_03590 [Candidatus Hodarchaeales archaeon]|jgi:hypothetical protein
MDVVHFFGEKLAIKINKAVLPASGLIRMSIRDMQKHPETITFEELKNVFQDTLIGYLEKLRIANVEEVSSYMVSELIKNQSLFTMRVK